MPDQPWQQLPFEGAIEYFRDKRNIDTDSWRDVQGIEYDAAFAVAGAKGALLQDMREAVDKAIAQGTTLQEFRKDFNRIVQTRGWDYAGDRDWRTYAIYDTNLRTAYAAGRWEQIQEGKASRPYLQWRHGGSRDPRPLHLALDKQVFRVDDPFWATMGNPPIGYNCFPPGTLVATQDGWKNIEEIKRGDLVVGGSGDLKPCIGTHFSCFKGELIDIRINDRSFCATPNHRVLTLRGWVEASSLEVEDVIVQVPQISTLDKFVSDVDQRQSPFANSLMTTPVNRSGLSDALYADSDLFDLDVNPVRLNVKTEFSFPTATVQKINQPLLIERRRGVSVGMPPWLSPVHLGTIIFSFLRHYWVKKRTAFFQLFRQLPHPLVSLFAPAKIRVIAAFLSRKNLQNNFSAFIPSGWVSNVLKGDRLTLCDREAKMLDQLEDSVIAHPPSCSKLSGGQHLLSVETPESVFSGQPLASFNSLDDFGAWAAIHCSLNKIDSIGQKYYIGTVYNISVLADESYCIPAGIVHNCRCQLFALKQRDVDRLGLSVTEGPEMGSVFKDSIVQPDPGWGGGHGRSTPESRRNLLVNITKRLHPALAMQVEQEARFASLRMSKEFGQVEATQLQGIRDRAASIEAEIDDLPRADGLYSVIAEQAPDVPEMFRGMIDGMGDLQAMAIVDVKQEPDAIMINSIVTAPWNLRGMPPTGQQVKGAGTRLIADVARESVELGYGGRIRLSASPEAVEYYRLLGFVGETGSRMTLSPENAQQLIQIYHG